MQSGVCDRKGFVLLEALVALTVLSLVISFIIQALAVSLTSSEKLRDSFEACLLLDNLLFDIKSDEKGELLRKPHQGNLNGSFMNPNVYTYRVDSRVIVETQKQWGDQTLYHDFDVQIGWKDGREYLLTKTVGRIKKQSR